MNTKFGILKKDLSPLDLLLDKDIQEIEEKNTKNHQLDVTYHFSSGTYEVYFIANQKLEIGDIFLEKDKAIFAVKMAHSSRNISHLMLQVKNASNAIILNPQKITNQLKEAAKNQGRSIDINLLEKVSIVVGIAHSKNKKHKLPEVPFFAKMSIIDLFQDQKFSEKIDWKIMSIEASNF